MDNSFENIIPWNGANDTGRDVRLKWERNFAKIGLNFAELAGKFTTVDEMFDLIAEELTNRIRKDQPDTAAELITFIKGLKSLSPIEVGEVIDSMLAGRGTLITPDKIQTPRLEVRGQAVFMELILNRLSAMEGDTSFSESGTIDEVEPIDATTYRLKMRSTHSRN